MRPCNLALAAHTGGASQRRAALLRNEAATVRLAVPPQAGRRRGGAPAPHEHDLNMIRKINDLAIAVRFLEGRGKGICDPTGMRDNWDKDLPSRGIKDKVNWKWHVSFFRWDGGESLDYLSVIYFIFRIGP